MLITLCMNNGATMDGVPRGDDAGAPAAPTLKRMLMKVGLSWLAGLIVGLEASNRG